MTKTKGKEVLDNGSYNCFQQAQASKRIFILEHDWIPIWEKIPAAMKVSQRMLGSIDITCFVIYNSHILSLNLYQSKKGGPGGRY